MNNNTYFSPTGNRGFRNIRRKFDDFFYMLFRFYVLIGVDPTLNLLQFFLQQIRLFHCFQRFWTCQSHDSPYSFGDGFFARYHEMSNVRSVVQVPEK